MELKDSKKMPGAESYNANRLQMNTVERENLETFSWGQNIWFL